MANNCLVTQFNREVEQDLPKLGELQLNVKAGSISVRALANKSFVVRAAKNILSLTQGGPYSKEVAITNVGGDPTMYPIYVLEDSKVYLSNKYDGIGRIEGTDIVGELDLNYSSVNNLGAGGFPNLSTLILNSALASLYAKVENIVIPPNYTPGSLTTIILDTTSKASVLTTAKISQDFPNVVTLQGPQYSFLGGDVANLGRCGSLTNISGGEYSGNLEGFVASACAFASKTTGSVSIRYASYFVHYKEAAVATDSTARTLTWSPSGDNISISYDGSTTVIHVNSDGSWTRVS